MAAKIDFMGLPLKNPVVVAAGPWSGGAAGIQKCIDAGAAAVVTETIVMEEKGFFGPRIFCHDGEVLNLSLYGQKSIEEWEDNVERIQKRGSFLICSIHGSSPSEIAYIAKKTERLGADALQLDIFAPMDNTIEEINIQPEKLHEMIQAVVKSVNIPVMVRLPYNISATTAYIRAVERAGTAAISAIESLRGLAGVDVETCCPSTSSFAGYTGRHVRPVSLAATATLSQLTNCQICSVGGVEDYQNILEFIMLGATAVQLGSVIMLNGYDVIAQTVQKLDEWMNAHSYADYADIRGAALKTLYPHEKAAHARVFAGLTQPCARAECRLCESGCMYDAILFNEKQGVKIDEALCTGCGLCQQQCPNSLIEIKERTQTK